MPEDLSVYHILVQLLKELKINDISSIDTFVEKLNTKDVEGNFSEVERKKIIETIVNRSENPSRVLKIYESLNTKNIPTLDKVLKLIFMITSNPKIKSFLSANKTRTNQRLINLTSLQNNMEKYKSPFLISPEIFIKPDEPLKTTEFSLTLENVFETRKYLRAYEAHESAVNYDTSFLKQKSPREQELLALDDILYVLMGFNGRFITLNKSNLTFEIDKNFNQRILSMLERILSLPIAYFKIVKFLEKYPPGFGTMVHQAFSSAIFSIQKEYLQFICELQTMFRNGELNLQKLLYLKETSITEMQFIASICSSINIEGVDSRSVLSILHNKHELSMSSGICLSACEFLMNSASKPYFDMISEWIYRGVILDYHHEFMISSEAELNYSKSQQDDHKWEKSHVLIHDRVPEFLKSVANKILNAGKYLNVLQQCGMGLKNIVIKKFVYSYGNEYYELINEALSNASKSLLSFIIEEKQFRLFLNSLRHFFLIDRGDFFVIFMDLVENILIKPKNEIDISRLDSLLELAIRNSVFSGDTFAEKVGITLLEEDLETHQLHILGAQNPVTDKQSDGIKSFAFTYNVDWPLSLIINSMAITKYQMIFRHLLNIKYCLRTLSKFWQLIFKLSVSKSDFRTKSNYSFILIVINKMMHFLQNFEYFIQNDVIDPNWNILMSQINKAESLEELISKHNDFLDRTLKDCMLTHSKLVESFSSIINQCYSFPNEVMKNIKSNNINKLTKTIEIFHDVIINSVSSFVFLLYGKNGDHFEHNMIFLVEKLDFNYFYSNLNVDMASLNPALDSVSQQTISSLPDTQ